MGKVKAIFKYPHSELLQMGRELMAQEINTVLGFEKNLSLDFAKAIELILNQKGHLIICGMGKSGLIGQKISATLASTGTPSFFLHASEALHGDLGMIKKEDCVLAISHSGETSELISVVHYLKRRNIKVIGMTKSSKNSLGRLADICLEVPVSEEICPYNLSPTTSTLGQLLLGDVLAITLLKCKKFTPMQFATLHPAGNLGRRLLEVSALYHPLQETPLVQPDVSVSDALTVLTEKGFGAVIVCDARHFLKGILCDGDIRRLYVGGKFSDGRVESVMIRNPKRIQEKASAMQALELMEHGKKITVLPVVDEKDKVLGILHMHDLVKAGLT
ncbi:SIS domain-containing protein [Candidatus Riflebacteria bacterium]